MRVIPLALKDNIADIMPASGEGEGDANGMRRRTSWETNW